MMELFHLNVDLLTNGHEARPMLRYQRHVLVWCGRESYFYFTQHDVQHPILLASEKEYTVVCVGGGSTPTLFSKTAAAAASAT